MTTINLNHCLGERRTQASNTARIAIDKLLGNQPVTVLTPREAVAYYYALTTDRKAVVLDLLMKDLAFTGYIKTPLTGFSMKLRRIEVSRLAMLLSRRLNLIPTFDSRLLWLDGTPEPETEEFLVKRGYMHPCLSLGMNILGEEAMFAERLMSLIDRLTDKQRLDVLNTACNTKPLTLGMDYETKKPRQPTKATGSLDAPFRTIQERVTLANGLTFKYDDLYTPTEIAERLGIDEEGFDHRLEKLGYLKLEGGKYVLTDFGKHYGCSTQLGTIQAIEHDFVWSGALIYDLQGGNVGL